MARIIPLILQKTGTYNLALAIHERLGSWKNQWALNITLPMLKNCRLLRKLHYGLFSQAFDHEMEMYVHARHHYLKSRSKNENTVLLRRYIHGLEKGLMTEPRKPVFALDYIGEAVEIFLHLKQTGENKSLLDWAHDVLTKYFATVTSHPQVELARSQFGQTAHIKANNIQHTPYRLSEEGQAPKDGWNFEQLVKTRKSVRWFEAGRIPEREKIEKAIELAALAPSSCNRQPFEFRVFDQQELVDKIMHLAPGTRGFNENTPMVIVVNGRMDVSPSPDDRHLMYIDASLAAMNLMNALHSMGIGSCAINWPDMERIEKPMRKLVKMKPYTRPIMLIAVGYARPSSMVACSTRKGLNELRKYNE